MISHPVPLIGKTNTQRDYSLQEELPFLLAPGGGGRTEKYSNLVLLSQGPNHPARSIDSEMVSLSFHLKWEEVILCLGVGGRALAKIESLLLQREMEICAQIK